MPAAQVYRWYSSRAEPVVGAATAAPEAARPPATAMAATVNWRQRGCAAATAETGTTGGSGGRGNGGAGGQATNGGTSPLSAGGSGGRGGGAVTAVWVDSRNRRHRCRQHQQFGVLRWWRRRRFRRQGWRRRKRDTGATGGNSGYGRQWGGGARRSGRCGQSDHRGLPRPVRAKWQWRFGRRRRRRW